MFQRKILAVDPLATFETKNQPYTIRCGKCARMVRTKKNEIFLFKRHYGSDRCQDKPQAERSIMSFFPKISTQSHTNSPTRSPPLSIPCPGLTHNDDARITTYLRRTIMPSGGAPPRAVLWEQHTSSAPDEPDDVIEKRVLADERHRAKWINNHISSSVYSPRCTTKAFVLSSSLYRM